MIRAIAVALALVLSGCGAAEPLAVNDTDWGMDYGGIPGQVTR